VREIVPRLQSGQSIERPYLGLSTSASSTGRGVVVAEATAGGPAQRAGLRAGDVVVRVDGEAIAEPDDVAKAIADNQPGDRVSIEVRRGGAAETLTVELANRPERIP
jgi:serine protease Do